MSSDHPPSRPTARPGASDLSIDTLSSAPTPTNTHQEADGFASIPLSATSSLAQPTAGASPPPSLASYPSYLHSTSSHASSHLLSETSSASVPYSTKSIPAPPLALRSIINPDPATPSDELTPSVELVKLGDLEASASRCSPPKQSEVDAARLQQLGYDAVLGRDYTFWSSLCISWLNIGCLQGTIYAVSGAYSYGGPLMILVAWPISGVFSICLTLSLGELSSAYPVAGAMASWAWKVARGGVGGERKWGWLMGGLTLGGHVGSVLLVTWEIANVIVGTMSLASDYVKQDWHMTLFFLATLLVCGGVGSTAWGRSHRFWLISGIFGFAVWLVLCIVLLATNATSANATLMTQIYYNETGWSSRVYVFLLGWEFCTIASGMDASAHMAEETQNPSRNVPNAMVAAMALTYVLGYISMILLLLAISPQDAADAADASFTVGFILTRAISVSGAIPICVLLIVVLHLQVMAQLQATSRFVFALARDNALPFSQSIRRTNSSKQPVIANWVVIGLSAPFCVLTLNESTLYSVLAVGSGTLTYSAYVIPVALYLFSKKDLQTEGRMSWSLRRWSKPMAVISTIFGLAVIVVQSFPGTYPVTADSFSWTPAVLLGTAGICFLTWRFYGDKHYSGPIRALTKWEAGMELDLQGALTSSKSKQQAFDDASEHRVVPVITLESVPTSVEIGTEWTDSTQSGATTQPGPGESFAYTSWAGTRVSQSGHEG